MEPLASASGFDSADQDRSLTVAAHTVAARNRSASHPVAADTVAALTRRAFAGSLAGACVCLAADKSQAYPSEAKRYTDEATENTVVRLTDPAHQSWLPAYYARAISRKSDFLIYSSDRSGLVQAYRLDLKNGQSLALTIAPGLVASSLTLAPDDREYAYLAGRSFYMARLNGGHAREVYRLEEGFNFGTGFSLSDDGLVSALVEEKPGLSRIRLIAMHTGAATTVAESPDPVSDPQPRPKRAGLLYRKADELWVVNYDGAQNRRMRIAPGSAGTALWSADGRSVDYLNIPADRKQLNNIREFTPDTNEDQFVSATSQFAAFNRNGDTSVFVGASGSKASPYLLLLVRSVKRELTLCQHRASDPRLVTSFFSPNSQRVVFQSDRDGKMALYSIAVERLVEETETEEP
jgi:oligogalacturonide lyase